MLFALALIPVIFLLIFIYCKDKKEKEPKGLLIGLFFAGMATIISAMIIELIGQVILELIFYYYPVLQALLMAMLVVAPAEELGKFLVLWLITWKNKHFDYSYDAIVYAVFVSLGFAAFENVGYVFSRGFGTAIIRMFTAVPGHACWAVLMGFFYSKAKYGQVTKNKKAYHWNFALAMLVPILLHGIYDGILMGGQAADNDIIAGLSVIAWIILVIAIFIVCTILVHKSSKNDYCIMVLPENVETVYRPSIVGTWTCGCGKVNNFNFCPSCGSKRPIDNSWNCPSCGTLCSFKFCGNCGFPKPINT